MIPYGKQNISEADVEAVIKVLRSDYLTQGPIVPEFEQAVSKYCGAKHGVAVNSATSALHIACLALGVGKGDWVWTSAITFVASANCAVYCGANVDFVDINPKTYNMSVESLAVKLELAEKKGKLPKVVIPVHLSGQSCNMAGIYLLSEKYGFKIIEDASHAIGGKYQQKPIGNCQFSDIAVFSFHPVKVITAGEGGMAVTNDSELHSHMQRLKSHGITRVAEEMAKASDGLWYYEQIELGFNYRMTDLLAALGLSQLKRLDEFVAQRHLIVEQYNDLFKDSSVITPWQDSDSFSSFHLYIIRIKQHGLIDHRVAFERFRANGIMVNLHYIPVYHHPFFEEMGYNRENFPEAERYYAEAISLPIYPGLTEEQINSVVTTLFSPLNHQTLF